jgi:hypothetical protein
MFPVSRAQRTIAHPTAGYTQFGRLQTPTKKHDVNLLPCESKTIRLTWYGLTSFAS